MHSEKVKLIDESNFEREVLGSPVPFLLDITAPWCGPCKRLIPVLDRLADESQDAYRVGVIDGEASPTIIQRLRVRGFPTVVAFVGGAEHGRHAGLTSIETLRRMVTGGD